MDADVSVVLASNRGPISFVAAADGFETKRGAGGLAGAVDPVARQLGDRAIWVAAATSEADRDALAAGAADKLDSQLGYRVHLLSIDQDDYEQYYNEVSNRMLWFANHCLWDEVGRDPSTVDPRAWTGPYHAVNHRFAGAVAEVGSATALALFQDYHLALAPRFLRELKPNQTIGHFTHSSFCGPRGFERLPEPIALDLVEGMLGADVAGFHIPRWARGFLEACRACGFDVDLAEGVVSHAGRQTFVRCYPIPIDAGELRERAGGSAALGWAGRFQNLGPGPLLVRADRTEPSKNIVRGFHAFGALLDRRADLSRTARFAACLYPSRQSLGEYRHYRAAIDAAAAQVNERHPGSVHVWLEDDFDRTLGALTTYDALLVNPIMDGMNLVSKEGPALNERDGVVVLSRGAGSFDELGDHVVEIVDALDVEETSRAIEKAFDLPRDSRARHAAALRHAASTRSPRDWIEAQVADLASVSRKGLPDSPPPAL